MKKVQLTLTSEEVEIINIKAAQIGYNITKYIKLLLGREVLDTFKRVSYPTFKMSQKAKTKVAEAQREYLKGKTVKLRSVNDLDKLA